MNTHILTLLFCLLLSWPSHASAADSVRIENPWIREAPPNARVLAGYMSIHNPTDRQVTLSTISSPDFAAIEIHQSSMTNGVMQMVKLDELRIEAGQTVHLAPGSYHLMLFTPRQPMRTGDRITLQLFFKDAGEQRVIAVVSKRAP